MQYYDDSQISGSKLNIGKKTPLDAAILGYAAAPEITPEDFSINILYTDNSHENRYVPVLSSDGNIYSIDLSNVLNFRDLKITDRYDDYNNPLYYKEVVTKNDGDSLQVIKNGEILFDGFVLDDSQKGQFVVYHSFQEADNVYLVLRSKKDGVVGAIQKIPLCYNPVFTQIVNNDALIPKNSFKIEEEYKRILLNSNSNIEVQSVAPNTRSGIEIEYNISGIGTVDFSDNDVEINLGVLALYDEAGNYAPNDAIQFIERFLDFSKSITEDKITFLDPLNKNHLISKEDFQQHYNLYDVVLIVGEGSDEGLADYINSYIKSGKILIYDCCGSIESDILQKNKEDVDASGTTDGIIFPKKTYVGEIPLSGIESKDGSSITVTRTVQEYIADVAWVPSNKDFVKGHILKVKDLEYTTDGTEITFEFEGKWDSDDSITLSGTQILSTRQYSFREKAFAEKEVIKGVKWNNGKDNAPDQLFVDQYGDNKLILSELGFCKLRDNKNIGEQLELLLDIIRKLYSQINIKVNGLKDIIYPKNSLFKNEYDIIGYDIITNNGIDYAKKVISSDAKEFLSLYTRCPLEKIETIKIEMVKGGDPVQGEDSVKEEGPVKAVQSNNEIAFYATEQATQLLYNTNHYCVINNVEHSYRLDFIFSANNKTSKISKTIQTSYIPRKQHIPIYNLISVNAIESLLSQDQGSTLKILNNGPLNIMLYDTKNHIYLTDAKDIRINLASINKDVVLEVSEIKYELNIANNIIAVASTNAFADSIQMPKNLKTYQNWSPLIKDLDFCQETTTARYYYKTMEFLNQAFYKDHLKQVKKEECVSVGWQALDLQHQHLSRNQTATIEKELLTQVTDYVFVCKHIIEDPDGVEIYKSFNQKWDKNGENPYSIYGNMIRFKSSIKESGESLYITYSYNYLKIYGLSTNIQSIKYVRTTTIDNIEYTRRLLGYQDCAFVDKNNVRLYTKINNEFREVDPNYYFVDMVTNSIILKSQVNGKMQADAMRKTYYISGLITKKIEYEIDFINYEKGIVYTKEQVDFRDTIFADYLYEAKEFELHCSNGNILDLNPLRGHFSLYGQQTYSGKDLINLKCFVVLFPYKTETTYGITEHEGPTTRFTFNEKEADLWVKLHHAIKLGSICLVNNFDLSDVSILDARSLGGGLKEEYSNQDLPAAKFWNDIEDLTDQLYRPGGLLIVKLPKQLLLEYGGVFEKQYVETVVSNYQPLGCHYKIEFYDLFDSDLIDAADFENPQLTRQDIINRYLTYKARD